MCQDKFTRQKRKNHYVNYQNIAKRELLFSTVELVNFGVGHWPQMNHIFNKDLSVYLDCYAPDFPKSTSKYLCCTQEVREHSFKCFTGMCHFWMQYFFKRVFLSCSIIQTFTNAYVQCIIVEILLFFLVKYGLHVRGCFFNIKCLQIGCFD